MLNVVDLAVTYGGLQAVDRVSLSVPRGELVGLIGPNGAGKTTLVDALSGFVPYQGTAALDGRLLDGLPPHARARLGLVRSFQSVELFADLDVRGNLLVAAARPRWWSAVADLITPGRASSRHEHDVEWAAWLLAIEVLLGRSVDELSEGERKLVGLARALARRPRLLMLDEPAAGLDTSESQALGERLRAIVDAGVTVLLVDHDMDLVLGSCDRVHVLETGALIASGLPADIRRDERVVAAYLGTAAP